MNRTKRQMIVFLIVTTGVSLLLVWQTVQLDQSTQEMLQAYGLSSANKNEQKTASQVGNQSVDEKGMQKAMLAAGCFWHVESFLQDIPGVRSTTVGYTGGRTEEPNYVSVCAGKTGHAEAVEVIFDPKKVSYEMILNKFFDEHDAAAKEAKRSYHGGQYRSEIFYYNDEQKKVAEAVKSEREKKLGKTFFTEIEPVSKFTVAEDFHQDYLKIRGLKQCK